MLSTLVLFLHSFSESQHVLDPSGTAADNADPLSFERDDLADDFRLHEIDSRKQIAGLSESEQALTFELEIDFGAEDIARLVMIRRLRELDARKRRASLILEELLGFCETLAEISFDVGRKGNLSRLDLDIHMKILCGNAIPSSFHYTTRRIAC